MLKRILFQPYCLFKNIFGWKTAKYGTYVMYDKLSLLFLIVPKTANTSINATLLENIGEKLDKDDKTYKGVHKLKRKYAISRSKANLIEAEIKLAVVRNPFDRLVSCYKDKILKDNSDIKKCYFGMFKKDMSFEEFVSKVCAIPDFISDVHFKSQSAFLFQRGKPLFNTLLKFENLEQDFEPLRARLGLNNLPVLNSSKKDNYKQYYTPELKRKVYLRYKGDFDNFGYSPDL